MLLLLETEKDPPQRQLTKAPPCTDTPHTPKAMSLSCSTAAAEQQQRCSGTAAEQQQSTSSRTAVAKLQQSCKLLRLSLACARVSHATLLLLCVDSGCVAVSSCSCSSFPSGCSSKERGSSRCPAAVITCSNQSTRSTPGPSRKQQWMLLLILLLLCYDSRFCRCCCTSSSCCCRCCSCCS